MAWMFCLYQKTLSDSLLDKVSTEIEKATDKGGWWEGVTLVEDGWGNNNNKSVIATCIYTEDKAYFLGAIELLLL